MKSNSPGGGKDHTLSANGVTHDDTGGSEKLALQAQKDLVINVKNNMIASVGANRSFTVNGNDTENISHYQTTTVGQDRWVEVVGYQTHRVGKDIVVMGRQNHNVLTKQDYVSDAEGQHIFRSDKKTLLTVGASTIQMLPDAIIIDSPTVFINPGPTFMAALAAGASVGAASSAAATEAATSEGAQKVLAKRAELKDLAKRMAGDAPANSDWANKMMDDYGPNQQSDLKAAGGNQAAVDRANQISATRGPR